MNERTGQSQRSAGASDAPAPEAHGGLWAAAFSVYGALDDVALIALGNRGLLRRGRAELAAGRVAPVNEPADPGAGAQPVAEEVTIGVGRPPVPVTLTVSGPQDARCPCPVAGICVHILAACLWMRQAIYRDGADESTTAADTPTAPACPEARATSTPAQATSSDPVLEEVLAWEPTDVEKSLGAEARRRAQASLAAAWSLTQALTAVTGLPDPALIGRADTETAQTGLLLPLSATWWTAPSGSRGLTIRLWDLDNGQPEMVTTGRATGTDAAFHYSQDATLLWGTSVRNILSGPLRLTGAQRRPDGSLAPSNRTSVTRRSTDPGYDDIDLEAMADHLQRTGTGPGAARFEAPVPRLRLIMVAQDGLGPISIDEVHQHYLLAVTSTDGCRHLLCMEVGGWEIQMVSDVLSRDLQVYAITVEGDRPSGVFVREHDRISLLAATFPPSRAVPGRGRGRSRRGPEEAGTQEAETNGEDRTPIRVLVQDVREALTALAASGAMQPTGMVAHVLRTRVRRAGDLQLATLVAALAEVGDRPSPGAVLRACAVVDRLAALTP